MSELLKQGDVIKLKKGMRVYADVPEHFVYSNKRGSFKMVHSDVTLGGEFDYLIGKYIVIKTSNDGGGRGMGRNDYYPDGHHVFCKKVDDETKTVDFYQSGSFTAMIVDIKPVGTAQLKWSI